jgi:dienelactone hydrolase
MHRYLRYFSLGFGLCAGAAAWAAETGPGAPPVPAATNVAATTPIGSGPYRAIMEAAPGLPTHTIYRPAKLAEAGTLPIVVWGNGGCRNQGNAFRWFLSDIASYGYLVVAVGPIAAEPMALPTTKEPIQPSPANAAAAAKLPPPATRTSQLIDAIDWAIAQNERSESPFFHRLNTTRIAVMGQSCGGVQAIEASADPRVTTTVVWNSGLFHEVTQIGGGKPLTKDDLDKLHGPTAYISGDDEDIAFVNANEDFEHLKKLPVLRAYERGVLHTATYAERNGGEFGGIGVAWLNWQLKGDTRAARLFVGADCGLCLNPRWVVQSKNLH